MEEHGALIMISTHHYWHQKKDLTFNQSRVGQREEKKIIVEGKPRETTMSEKSCANSSKESNVGPYFFIN